MYVWKWLLPLLEKYHPTDLVGLKMANEMPVDVTGRLASLLDDLLHVVLAEVSVSRFISLHNLDG